MSYQPLHDVSVGWVPSQHREHHTLGYQSQQWSLGKSKWNSETHSYSQRRKNIREKWPAERKTWRDIQLIKHEILPGKTELFIIISYKEMNME